MSFNEEFIRAMSNRIRAAARAEECGKLRHIGRGSTSNRTT